MPASILVGACRIVYTWTVPAPPLLTEALPLFAIELETLLKEQGEFELAAQIDDVRIMSRCQCGDDFCATFYTQAKLKGSYGAGYRNMEVTPKDGLITLDLVDGRITGIEVLFRDDVRDQLNSVFP